MSDQGGETDKSELPTPYRLEQARKKGQVARGMDLGFLTGLSAFSAYMWFLGDEMIAELAIVSRAAIAAAPGVTASQQGMIVLGGAVLAGAARPLMFLAGAVFVAVLVFEVVQTGGVLSTAPLKFDFNRLNPAQGLKRLFSSRLLVETGKSILKLAVYSTLAAMAVKAAVETSAGIADARSLALDMQRSGFRMLALFVAAASGFAILDQLIARRDFTKRMRMSRRDVRRESRDREGEPRQKQRRRQMHREFVKASESLRNIRGADVLVTNPTHYAVALRYDPQTMGAPLVVSRGMHRFALRLRRLAFLYNVVIVREPLLARALYRCEVNQPVPEAFYRPVADLYRALRARKASQEASRA